MAALSLPVWVSQLRILNRSCPWLLVIPPQADVKQYTADQLRRAVIDAIRACEAWSKGPKPSIRPKLSLSFPYGPVAVARDSQPPRLSPGGRFLAHMASGHHIQVVDLHNNGQVIWVHDIYKDCKPEKLDRAIIATYDIGVTKSGSLIIAYSLLAKRDRDDFVFQ